MKKILPFAFVVILFCCFITCKKEYSYEGGRLALFSLEGTPNECTEYLLSGNYYIAVPLDTGNTVTVTANVHQAGSYSITTNIIAGISFAASGNFADTGFQKIILQGSGIPDTTGTFEINILGDSACNFSVQIINKPPSQFVLEGDPDDCSNPSVNGLYRAGINLTNTNTVTLFVDVATPGSYVITTDTINGINFSASGTFTSNGAQPVILQGTGAPNNTGYSYFITTANSSQCHFYLPVQSNDPLATYVIESGSGQNDTAFCIYNIQGNYTAGTSLNNSNTVSIHVFVKDTGNYTISTKMQDGIYFYSSGTFTQTGEQTVSLRGFGTPQNIGSFSFLPSIIGPAPLGGEACDFSLDIK